MAAKSGIRTVAYNQICLTFLQKLCTADGGTVCDFDSSCQSTDFFDLVTAQSVEHAAVNRSVVGSSPTGEQEAPV